MAGLTYHYEYRIHERMELGCFHPEKRKTDCLWETVSVGYDCCIWTVYTDRNYCDLPGEFKRFDTYEQAEQYGKQQTRRN